MQNSKTFIKTAIGYIRSYKKERLNTLSTEEQEKLITEFAEKRGYRILKIFKEENISGSSFERPAFKMMLEYIKQNKYKVKFLLVADSQRLSNNASDFMRFKWFLRKQLITLISVVKTLVRDAEKQAKQHP